MLHAKTIPAIIPENLTSKKRIPNFKTGTIYLN